MAGPQRVVEVKTDSAGVVVEITQHLISRHGRSLQHFARVLEQRPLHRETLSRSCFLQQPYALALGQDLFDERRRSADLLINW